MFLRNIEFQEAVTSGVLKTGFLKIPKHEVNPYIYLNGRLSTTGFGKPTNRPTEKFSTGM